MPGFEIAGIVLGAIPLVISALERYGEGLSTLQKWRKYERELRSLTRNLETERVRLEDVCEKLLIGLVPGFRIESMIKDPLGDLWREEETLKKIRARLWKGFDIFEATIGDIKAAVDEMSKRIDSQRGGKVSEFKRAVFTLSRSRYADLLSTIRECISNLENLTDRNIELEPARRARFRGKFFILVRDMCKSLFRALRSSLDCTCRHDVSLSLESRSADIIPTDDEDKIMSDLAFQLALSYKTRTGDPETVTEQARIWEEILVKPTTMPKTQTFSAETLVSPTRPKKGKEKKSVSLAGSLTIASPTTTLVRTEIGSASMNLHKSIPNLTMGIASIGLSSFGASLNLCEKMNTARKEAQVDSYGTIIDQFSHTARRYTVYPVPAPEYEDTRCWSVISLREILEQKDKSLSLPCRTRLQLAVIVSSSILQLHGSPWLPDSLSSRDIFFIKRQNYPIYDHPFAIKGFSNNDPTSGKDETGIPALHNRNPTLLSLGVLLIELFLSKTLDSLRTPQEESLAYSNLLLDYITAQRLLDRVQKASSNYGTAVTRCLDGEFHKDNVSLDTEELCQDVYSGVVALLEKDLEMIDMTFDDY